MISKVLTREEFQAASAELCESLRNDHVVAEGHAFFTWTTCLVYRIVERVRERGSALAPSLKDLYVEWDRLQQPRQRKEFVSLYDGDTLIGQITIERPFDARDFLPFVERVHPDDLRLDGSPLDAAAERLIRVQRFNLENGRYRLEHKS
jgi:hypothetical protein